MIALTVKHSKSAMKMENRIANKNVIYVCLIFWSTQEIIISKNNKFYL